MISAMPQASASKDGGMRDPAATAHDRQTKPPQDQPASQQGAAELESLYRDIVAPDKKKLLDSAKRHLGRWASKFWDSLSGADGDLFQQVHPRYMSVFRPSQRTVPASASSRPSRYEQALALVAAHAVLSQIHELMDFCDERRANGIDEWEEPDDAPPGHLFGALMQACESDAAVETLIAKEAAARLQMSPTHPELARHVGQHLLVFKALGAEAREMAGVQTERPVGQRV